VYATRLLGGAIAVAAVGLAGGAGARFVALALLALGGLACAAWLAPRALLDGRPRTAPAEVEVAPEATLAA
jgi:hypothetical protein